jgi:hypothetical protein
MIAPIFYVYEHWRPDKDVCFWVGKGHGNRSRDFRRNFHYNNIVKKLTRLGMCVEVRMVQSGLSEGAAFALEKERIAFWRGAGILLSNYTDGGEGVSGLKHSKQTRRKIREKRKAQKIAHSAETRRKIGAANAVALKGRKNPAHAAKLRGRKHRPEHTAKIVAKLIGRPVSEETRAKIRASNLGQKRSEVTKQRLRDSHLGKKLSLKTRKKMVAAQLARWAKIREAQPCLP